jgi:hypothetical protein
MYVRGVHRCEIKRTLDHTEPLFLNKQLDVLHVTSRNEQCAGLDSGLDSVIPEGKERNSEAVSRLEPLPGTSQLH